MNEDDPRHGTTPGYHAGCREACCRRAIARYEKVGRLARLRGGRAIPAIGAQRRIQALMRLGWTSQDIADAAGWNHRNAVLRILNGQKGKPCTWLERETNDRITAVYERLSMRIPTGPYRDRGRRQAERKGWPPPLAWDDIDNPNESPKGPHMDTKIDIDPVVVDRILAGRVVPATRIEREEVCRRWRASGRPMNELERLTGWQVRRYAERPGKDAA